MRTGRFSILALVALLLLANPLRAAVAAPGNATLGRALTTDRRIVSTNNPPFELGFGSALHVPGEPCMLFPPELNLQDLTFERSPHGYLATAIFFNPITPLSELNGNPVTYTVNLVLAPPKGNRITVRASMTSGKVTVKQGKTALDLGDTPVVVTLAIDRVVFALPDALGIAPDWDVRAEATLGAKEPWCAARSPKAFTYTAATPPASVGSLTGEDPVGVVTAPAIVYDGDVLAKTGVMPAGAKLESLTFEHDPDGGLVAVATMNGDVADLVKAAKDPSDALFVDIDLADPSFFGITYPYRLTWSFFPKANPEPVARVEDPYLGAAYVLGTVPVTVAGERILFHLGAFTAINYPLIESTSLPLPVGDFQTIFFDDEPETDSVCICPPELAPEADPAGTLLVYEIIGNLITITRPSTGEVAAGWIDHAGRFWARNDTELYRGAIGFFPLDDGYEVGVQAIHVRLLDQQPDSSAGIDAGSTGIAAGEAATSGRLLPMATARIPVRTGPFVPDIVYTIGRMIKTNPKTCKDLLAPDYEQNPAFKDLSDAELLRFRMDCSDLDHPAHRPSSDDSDEGDEPPGLAPLPKTPGDGPIQQSPPQGQTNPPSSVVPDDNIFAYAAPATPIAAPGVPFPLPFTIATPYEPQATDGDWAIRASSTWNYTRANGEAGSVSVTTPFVDSHLILGGAATASTTADAPAALFPGSVVLTEPARPGRRLRVIRARRTPAESAKKRMVGGLVRR